jgi:hypothetical protein
MCLPEESPDAAPTGLDENLWGAALTHGWLAMG